MSDYSGDAPNIPKQGYYARAPLGDTAKEWRPMKDKNGKPLEVGSQVIIRGKVVHLSEQENGNNTTVETIELLPGSANPTTKSRLSVSSKQIELDEGEPKAVGATSGG